MGGQILKVVGGCECEDVLDLDLGERFWLKRRFEYLVLGGTMRVDNFWESLQDSKSFDMR